MIKLGLGLFDLLSLTEEFEVDNVDGGVPVELVGFVVPKQEGDALCWAAVAVSIMSHGEVLTATESSSMQCALAKEFLKPDCLVCGSADCDKPMFLENVLSVMRPMPEALPDFVDIINFLEDTKKPIILRVSTQQYSSTHYVVISGYKPGSREQMLVIRDPAGQIWGDRTHETMKELCEQVLYLEQEGE